MTIQFNDQQELVVPGLDIEGLASLDPADGNAYIGFTAGSHKYASSILPLPLLPSVIPLFV